MLSKRSQTDYGQYTWLSLLPIVVLLAASLMLLHFLLPSAHDTLTESYEPTKTLRFFYTYGRQVHKWGPMPAFVYAPIYAALLTFYRITGHLGQVSSRYPFGLDDPARALGRMIFSARLITLLGALSGTYYLTRTLQRRLKSGAAPVLAVLLSLSTSVVFLQPLTDSKPDGLMIAFLLFALANYAAIVLDGWTRARAIGLAFFFVASISCKELTSVTFAVPYLALMALSIARIRHDPVEGRRELRLAAASCLSALLFYLVINVLYAPHSWWARMTFVFGPLKDPSIWAAANQTQAGYLLQSLLAIQAGLGWSGLLLLVIALAGTAAQPSLRLLLLWLPFLSHAVFTVATAGYMPAYFMLPLGPALCLPASLVLSRLIERWEIGERPLAAATVALTLGCAWIAFCSTGLFRFTHVNSMLQSAFDQKIPPGTTVNIVGLLHADLEFPATLPRGASIDPRPLSEIMSAPPGDRPDYLLVPTDLRTWAKEIRYRPARAAMLKKQTGFDYSSFTGFEPLGYSLVETVGPRLPAWCRPSMVAGSGEYVEKRLLIYRLRLDGSRKTAIAQAGP